MTTSHNAVRLEYFFIASFPHRHYLTQGPNETNAPGSVDVRPQTYSSCVHKGFPAFVHCYRATVNCSCCHRRGRNASMLMVDDEFVMCSRHRNVL